jgi:uncharacterized membrane protein
VTGSLALMWPAMLAAFMASLVEALELPTIALAAARLVSMHDRRELLRGRIPVALVRFVDRYETGNSSVRFAWLA